MAWMVRVLHLLATTPDPLGSHFVVAFLADATALGEMAVIQWPVAVAADFQDLLLYLWNHDVSSHP